ncbi:hypothetical protein [Leminorella grimontii]|uniref:hypothetical protein n=1 Tax=Leminorella grimontii TaxID=82981 RepID=UPI0021C35D82|nr:hypothetical protein [Leminorella grimontii]
MQAFNGFNPAGTPFHTISFQVNKEQFKEMMMNIYNNSMFHGKKPFIIGILSVIGFFALYNFAYHTTWGQIGLIICCCGALGLLLAPMYYFPSSAFKKQVEKDYLSTDMSLPFTYKFYEEGIEVNSPVMNGRFGWRDIHMASIEPTGAIFGFIKNTPNGKAIIKQYKDSYASIILPFMFLDNPQEEILFFKQLSQANVIKMTFSKSI